MDIKRIVARGDTAKYKVTVHHADFSQERDDYNIVLEYGIMGGEMTVSKDMRSMLISNTDVGEGTTLMTFCFTDLYGQRYWTSPLRY